MKLTATGTRIDWQTERGRIDLAAVATRLLGPAPGRRGERGRRLWWRCPFHEDKNPSFMIEPGKPRWKCWGCGEHGDAAALVMAVRHCSFSEAKAYLTGGPAPSGNRPLPTARPLPRPEAEPPRPPEGMPEADALALVESAAARLWQPEGAAALAYLASRGLAPETIRAARLGWTPRVQARTRDGRDYSASGVVIPWWYGDRLALVKIRQPEGRTPKYAEVYRNPDRPPTCYPGPESIRPGRPVILVEGEFDTLLLGQALGERAAVATLGSASAGPDPRILGLMLAATTWFVAHDADPAGDRAAAYWTAFPRARRVRPPTPFKDWTEAGTDAPGTVGTAMNLRRWWLAILGGDADPPLFTTDELSSWRWGPALLPEDDPARDLDE